MKSRSSARRRKPRKLLRCSALRIEQHPEHPLYVFALTGEQLWTIASVSHIGRTGSGRVIGYQSPPVKRHIRSIIEYLDSGPALLPNSLVVALNSNVRFIRNGGDRNASTVHGVLEIPLPINGDPKTG